MGEEARDWKLALARRNVVVGLSCSFREPVPCHSVWPRPVACLWGVILAGRKRNQPKSVMVPGLKKINRFVADTIHQPMFLRDAPRPTTCEQISQRFGLAQPLERIAHHRFDQVKHSDCSAPVGLDPKSQVLSEFGMENGRPFTLPLHRASFAVIQLRLPASFFHVRPGAAPPANAVRSAATEANGRFR
jgi:hypothetical protein